MSFAALQIDVRGRSKEEEEGDDGGEKKIETLFSPKFSSSREKTKQKTKKHLTTARF